jgi:hypothetical protein
MLSSSKLYYKWLGLYRIAKVEVDKATYILEEIDRTLLSRTFIRSRLKGFIKRENSYKTKELDSELETDIDSKIELEPQELLVDKIENIIIEEIPSRLYFLSKDIDKVNNSNLTNND